MFASNEEIPWINGTPLGIKMRDIEFIAPHIHEDIIEIIFCLEGSVKFSYEYEEFTLTAGEFISVDKDAHYIYDGRDDICVSFYINLNWYKIKYPFITSLLFVCEATKGSENPYPTYYHKQLKGMLIALLFFVGNHKPIETGYKQIIVNAMDKMIDMFINHFDIAFFYRPPLNLKIELMDRYHNMMVYLHTQSTEKISLGTMAEEFHLTEAYISEFLGVVNIGFRRCLGYVRANSSERLLLTTEMNIMEISEACGFSDPKYYYKAFREWYKCTPRQFRKRYRDKMQNESKEYLLDIKEAFEPLNKMMLNHYMDLFLFWESEIAKKDN